MYPLKVQKCPRVKSMMIVRLEFLGHGATTPTTVKFRRTYVVGQVASGTDGTDCFRRHVTVKVHILIDSIFEELHLAF